MHYRISRCACAPEAYLVLYKQIQLIIILNSLIRVVIEDTGHDSVHDTLHLSMLTLKLAIGHYLCIAPRDIFQHEYVWNLHTARIATGYI